MDDRKNHTPSVNTRRRKRTKMDNFKESYLPVIIAAATLIFIIFTIIGSSANHTQREAKLNQIRKEEEVAEQHKKELLIEEATQLLTKAEEYANNYYFDKAIETLQSFSGEIPEFPQLYSTLQGYYYEKANLVEWNDPTEVLNLSFHVLIADPIRAFSDSKYGSAYNRNFVTTDEFRLILEQLYANGYVLVNMDDIISETNTDGTESFTAKKLLLPEGKKPLILTQTHVNYYIYMTDGDDADTLPDKDGAGFASKLIIDESGNLLNEMVDKDGNTVTGEYDLIPILETFITAHPDFSYQGARAIIAVTGSEGVFGYRTNPGAKSTFGAAYDQEIEGAKMISQALRDRGYTIACYTYDNKAYGEIGIATLQDELKKWKDEVVPIIGQTEFMVFAQESDITKNTPYSGEKYNALMDAGFRYYFGFCKNGQKWSTTESNYFRQARILVTGSNLKYNGPWFNGILTPVEILSSLRGTIPQ